MAASSLGSIVDIQETLKEKTSTWLFDFAFLHRSSVMEILFSNLTDGHLHNRVFANLPQKPDYPIKCDYALIKKAMITLVEQKLEEDQAATGWVACRNPPAVSERDTLQRERRERRALKDNNNLNGYVGGGIWSRDIRIKCQRRKCTFLIKTNQIVCMPPLAESLRKREEAKEDRDRDDGDIEMVDVPPSLSSYENARPLMGDKEDTPPLMGDKEDTPPLMGDKEAPPLMGDKEGPPPSLANEVELDPLVYILPAPAPQGLGTNVSRRHVKKTPLQILHDKIRMEFLAIDDPSTMVNVQGSTPCQMGNDGLNPGYYILSTPRGIIVCEVANAMIFPNDQLLVVEWQKLQGPLLLWTVKNLYSFRRTVKYGYAQLWDLWERRRPYYKMSIRSNRSHEEIVITSKQLSECCLISNLYETLSRLLKVCDRSVEWDVSTSDESSLLIHILEFYYPQNYLTEMKYYNPVVTWDLEQLEFLAWFAGLVELEMRRQTHVGFRRKPPSPLAFIPRPPGLNPNLPWIPANSFMAPSNSTSSSVHRAPLPDLDRALQRTTTTSTSSNEPIHHQSTTTTTSSNIPIPHGNHSTTSTNQVYSSSRPNELVSGSNSSRIVRHETVHVLPVDENNTHFQPLPLGHNYDQTIHNILVLGGAIPLPLTGEYDEEANKENDSSVPNVPSALPPVPHALPPVPGNDDAPQMQPVVPSQMQPVAPSQMQPVAPSQMQPLAPSQMQPVAPSQIQTGVPSQMQPVAPSQIQTGVPSQMQPVAPNDDIGGDNSHVPLAGIVSVSIPGYPDGLTSSAFMNDYPWFQSQTVTPGYPKWDDLEKEMITVMHASGEEDRWKFTDDGQGIFPINNPRMVIFKGRTGITNTVDGSVIGQELGFPLQPSPEEVPQVATVVRENRPDKRKDEQDMSGKKKKRRINPPSDKAEEKGKEAEDKDEESGDKGGGEGGQMVGKE